MSSPSALRWVARALAWLAFASAPRADPLDGFYGRLGVLYLHPMPQSGPVVLSNVTGPAQLALTNGPVLGSGVTVGDALMPAATIGYRVWDQFTLETILAPPITLAMKATGTLATKPLAASALGNLPTGVAALGPNLGETKALPPVLTATYRFLPDWPVHPYLGAGASYMISYDTRITNPVLTSVHPMNLNLPPVLGWVVQAGADFHLWQGLFVTLDAKYIGGLDMNIAMRNLDAKVPGLPLYGTVHLGDARVHMSIDPLVFQGGVGWNF
jgi:outer membrane protein W